MKQKKIEALGMKLETIGYVTILIICFFVIVWAFASDWRDGKDREFRQNVGIAIEMYSKTLGNQ